MRILPPYISLVGSVDGSISRIGSKLNRHALLICTCLPGFSTSTFSQTNDEQAIRQQRKQSNEAIARHDTASIGQYFLDDVHVLTSRSTSLHGKSANLRAFQQEFQTKDEVVYVRTPGAIEVFSLWDMAAEYGRWTGKWVSNGETIRIAGSYYAKWHFENNKWKIKSEVYVPGSCEGSEYCKTAPIVGSTTAAIVVQNYYFPKPGKELDVMATRRRASQVRAKLGLPVGRILKQISESNAQPYIVWECEYPSLQAREDDVKRLDQSEEFKRIQDHMSTLLEKFDRAAWLIEK